MGAEYLGRNLPPVLTLAEEKKHGDKALKGNKAARDTLMIHNIRFVLMLAHDYVGRGVDYDDLVSSGMLGLEEAARKFNPKRGKFSVCAQYYIRSAMRDTISDMGQGVRRPLHHLDQMNQLHRFEDAFERDHDRVPTVEECAANLELPVKTIRFMRRGATHTESMDNAMGNETDSATFGETMPDESAPMPDDESDRSDAFDVVREAIKRLPQRWQDIICQHFGIGCPEKTLEEIGDREGVTRERIRQIQNMALLRLNQLLRKNDPLFGNENEHLVRQNQKRTMRLDHMSLSRDMRVCGTCGQIVINGESKTHACQKPITAYVIEHHSRTQVSALANVVAAA